jgi:hypothetical protein
LRYKHHSSIDAASDGLFSAPLRRSYGSGGGPTAAEGGRHVPFIFDE